MISKPKLWTLFKRYTLASYCPNNLSDLNNTAQQNQIPSTEIYMK